MIALNEGGVSNTPQKFPAQDNLNLHLEVSIDWLQGTGKLPESTNLLEFLGFLQDSYNEEFVLDREKPYNPGRQFNHSGRTHNGIRFAWSELADGQTDYWLSIPGSVLSALPLQCCDRISNAHVLAALHELFGFTATRIDVALDDYSKIISTAEVAELVRKPRDENGRLPHVTGVHDCSIFESQSKKTPGITVYFGSTKGEKRLRFYDKFAESQGKKDCNRWELQLRVYKAATLAREAIKVAQEIPEELCRFLAGYVLGAVNFVETHNKNLDRNERLCFWQRYIDEIQLLLRIPCPKKVHSVDAKVHWIDYSVSKTLAVLRKIFGIEAFNKKIVKFLEDAERRFTYVDTSFINNAVEHYKIERENTDPTF